MAKYEYELSALEGMGLSDVDLDSALTHILVVVASLAQANANQLAVGQVSALTDQDWWSDNAPFLAFGFRSRKISIGRMSWNCSGRSARGGAIAPNTPGNLRLNNYSMACKP